jgi:ketosteroid isomerase-like protein
MKDETALLAANAAYYAAFAASDFAAMSSIWADGDICCIHPGWPALMGRKPVLNSYREILRNPLQERVECRNAKALVCGSEARVVCAEVVAGTILAATNWFRRIDGVWRLIHHQASPIAISDEDAARNTSLH